MGFLNRIDKYMVTLEYKEMIFSISKTEIGDNCLQKHLITYFSDLL